MNVCVFFLKSVSTSIYKNVCNFFVHNFKVLISLKLVYGTIRYVLNENTVNTVLDIIPNIVIYHRYNSICVILFTYIYICILHYNKLLIGSNTTQYIRKELHTFFILIPLKNKKSISLNKVWF